jgi:hypothetical protein
VAHFTGIRIQWNRWRSLQDGKEIYGRGVSLIEMRGGRISRELDFWDTPSVMKQVGLSPYEKTEPVK